MGHGRTDEFRKDGVRIALTIGLTRKQVASDLGVGMSTLNKWITAYRDTDAVSHIPKQSESITAANLSLATWTCERISGTSRSTSHGLGSPLTMSTSRLSTVGSGPGA